MSRLLLTLSLLLVSLAAYALTVTGKVVGPDQQSIPHARLHVITGDYRNATTIMITGDQQNTLDLTSDENGAFSFTVNEAAIHDGIYAIGIVGAPGFAPEVMQFYAGHTTVTLQPADTIHGVVLDASGNPQAGVRVRFSRVVLPGGSLLMDYIPATWDDLFTTVTDTQGRWSFTLARPGALNVVNVDDPRYIKFDGAVLLNNIGKHPAPLVALPGGVLTGKVLTPNGTPAAGIKVQACQTVGNMSMLSHVVETDQDGYYRISSLRGGTLSSLMCTDPKQQYVIPSIPVDVIEGKEQHVPDITLLAAGVLEGTVCDSETGMPLPNVALNCLSEAQGFMRIETGDDGRYRQGVHPGKYSLILQRPAVGYLLPTQNTRNSVEVALGNTTTVDFRLKKGMTISGTLTDESGHPLVGGAVRLRELCDLCARRPQPMRYCENDIRAIVVADAQGRFTVNGLKPGKVMLDKSNVLFDHDSRLDAMDTWEIVSPTTVDIPGPGSLQIVLRRAATRRLTGRVVTPQGKPVAGVEVTISINTGNAGEIGLLDGNFMRVLTDTTGSFIADIRTDRTATLETIAKAGWMSTTRGAVKQSGDGLLAADSVMVPLTGQVRGTVKNAAGQPVVNAIVVPLELGGGNRVYSNTSGQFTVENLPEGAVSVLAITADGAGLWQGQTGANDASITLKPQHPTPPRDIATVSALWQQYKWQESNKRSAILRALLATDYDQAVKLLQDEGLPITERLRANILCTLAQVDPTRAAKVGAAELDLITTEDTRFETALALGMAVAKIDPTLGAHCLALTTNIAESGEMRYRLRRRMQTLPLIAQLPDGTANVEKRFAELFAIVNTPQNKDYCELLALKMISINPALAEQAWSKLEGDQLFNTLADVIQEIASTNLPEAQRLLEKCLAIQTYYIKTPTVLCVVNELGKTDPAAALALARKPIPDGRMPSLNGKVSSNPELLVAAAAFQPKETALQLCRDIVQSTETIEPTAIRAAYRAAALAQSLDLEEGKALFRQVKQREELFHGSIDGSYFYLAAPANPVECRIELESDHAAIRLHGGGDNNSVAPIALTLSMAQIDRDRALTMAAGLQAAEYNNPWDFNGFLDYLLADEQQRRTKFLNW